VLLKKLTRQTVTPNSVIYHQKVTLLITTPAITAESVHQLPPPQCGNHPDSRIYGQKDRPPDAPTPCSPAATTVMWLFPGDCHKILWQSPSRPKAGCRAVAPKPPMPPCNPQHPPCPA